MESYTPPNLQIPAGALINEKLSHIEKMLIAAIWELALKENGCSPSNEQLQKRLACSDWTVSQSISKVQKLGYIISLIKREKVDNRIITKRKIFIHPYFNAYYDEAIRFYYSYEGSLSFEALYRNINELLPSLEEIEKDNMEIINHLKIRGRTFEKSKVGDSKESNQNQRVPTFEKSKVNNIYNKYENFFSKEKNILSKESIIPILGKKFSSADSQKDANLNLTSFQTCPAEIGGSIANNPIQEKQSNPIQRKLHRRFAVTDNSISHMDSNIEEQSPMEAEPVPVSEDCAAESRPHHYSEKERKKMTRQLKKRTEESYRRDHPTRKKQTPIIAPQEIQEVLDLWETSKFKLPNPERAPAAWNNMIHAIKKLVKGTLIPEDKRKFTLGDIKEAIIRFAIITFNDEYGPANIEIKNKFAAKPLCDFLYTKDWSNCPEGNNRVVSWFLKCHEEGTPIKREVISAVPDNHPMVTQRLKNFFSKYVLSGVKKKTWAPNEEAQMRTAANRICEFYEKKMQSLPGIDSYADIADEFCKSIQKQYGNNVTRVFPGTFSSTFTLQRFIAYLKEQRLIDIEENIF